MIKFSKMQPVKFGKGTSIIVSLHSDGIFTVTTGILVQIGPFLTITYEHWQPVPLLQLLIVKLQSMDTLFKVCLIVAVLESGESASHVNFILFQSSITPLEKSVTDKVMDGQLVVSGTSIHSPAFLQIIAVAGLRLQSYKDLLTFLNWSELSSQKTSVLFKLCL